MQTSAMSKIQASRLSPGSDVQSPTSGMRATNDIGPCALDLRLAVSDLRKSFSAPTGERIDVLRGVSFKAAPGETVAITGASGAGKSTLLHLLGGLEAPDHGSIALGEFQVDRAGQAELASFRRSRVAFVFQFHYLLSDFSATENVALPLLIGRTSHAVAMRQADAALREFGMDERGSHRVSHLSGGEQQRVAICRALIKQPSLVLADEPTGNLDATTAEELGRVLISYSRRRQAIVIVATHNEKLAQLCDQILKIEEGRLIVVRSLDTSLK